jgi:hypothetical protein
VQGSSGKMAACFRRTLGQYDLGVSPPPLLLPSCLRCGRVPAAVVAAAAATASLLAPALPAPPRPGPRPSPLVEGLPAVAEDDTHLKMTLAASLEGCREIVRPERYAEAVRRLRRSEELVVASCLEAAEALAALGVRKEDLRDREKKEQLKAAKKAARDVLLWRCTVTSVFTCPARKLTCPARAQGRPVGSCGSWVFSGCSWCAE